MGNYFKKIDFDEFLNSLGLETIYEGEWEAQPNGVLIRQLISEEESKNKNVTYAGLKFFKPTDGHMYETQTETILFKGDGQIDFSKDGKQSKRPVYTFSDWDRKGIQIPPSVVRKIIPLRNKFAEEQDPGLEIELIVQPMFNPEDEIYVYD